MGLIFRELTFLLLDPFRRFLDLCLQSQDLIVLLDRLFGFFGVLVALLPVLCARLLNRIIELVHALLMILRVYGFVQGHGCQVSRLFHVLIVLFGRRELFFTDGDGAFELVHQLDLVVLLQFRPHLVNLASEEHVLLAALVQLFAFFPQVVVDYGLLFVAQPLGFLDLFQLIFHEASQTL